ncbi:MAG: response regulator [Candidatus Cloacimonetes bacterium]|nr:response regulator [Candidatus Cloacimonadota bacterium]
MEKLIVIVDDEPDILELVAINLQKAGYRTAECPDGASLQEFLKNNRPDLIILDLMLPDADGFDICRQLKADAQYRDLPVIMLTAKGDVTDRILGLEFGADDYIVKPFSPRELAARVKAILRRGQLPSVTVDSISIGRDLILHPQKHEVLVNSQPAELTTTEFKLLMLLAGRPGWVFTRNQILDHLWGNDKIVLDRTVDVHIRNLRDKLGSAGSYLKNIRGVGYKIETEK